MLLKSYLLVICLCWAPLRVAADSTTDLEAIDTFLQAEFSRNNLPGLAVTITQGEEVVFEQAYGVGVSAQTPFFIASLSKSMTALAVMQLVEAGQIDLDAPVQRYLPEFQLADDAAAAQISVRHLLNQTSGLADSGFPEGQLPQPETLAGRMESLQSAEVVSAPGAAFHYFNPNYAVLARLVEVVSGEPFDSYLATSVFAPLQMTQTGSFVTAQAAREQVPGLAPGHLMAYGLPFSVGEMDGLLIGSGGVVSTAEDMARYLIMQANGGATQGRRLVSADSLSLMHTPPADGDYGMGWMRTTENGVTVLEHTGILSAYYADMILAPDTHTAVILLYNLNGLAPAMFAFSNIHQGVVALLTGGTPAEGGLSLPQWGILAAGLTVGGVTLAVRSLLGLSRWRSAHRETPFWRLLPGIVWAFTPGIALLALPALVTAFSGRAFSYVQLARNMPDVLLWLGLCAILGAINGITRLASRLRRPVTATASR